MVTGDRLDSLATNVTTELTDHLRRDLIGEVQESLNSRDIPPGVDVGPIEIQLDMKNMRDPRR